MHRLLFLILSLVAVTTQADELEQAYQKEFAYLVAEKKALEQRLVEMDKQQRDNLKKVSDENETLQSVFLEKQNMTDRLNRQIVEASRGVDNVQNDKLILDTTLNQAVESLKKLNREISQTQDSDVQLEDAFRDAIEVLDSDGRAQKTDGSFFLASGEMSNGSIINVGRIAKYGISPQGGGILAPAGNNQFKVWSKETQTTAQQLADKQYPDDIDVFLFENTDKSIEKEAEKTWGDDIEAGGMVGKVIIALGIFGIVLVAIRIALLKKASANIQQISDKVNREINGNDFTRALEVCKQSASAASNVIAATLRNINRDRDHIEDIISESILHESSFIDRFGSAILVIAAVSPLLGLLGTVTGMISTFDIITEFGTGDPKLLSSGISEALLTTKFGLVVAIPLLLTGNILTSWAQTIKNEMEQAALHMINTYKS